MGEIVTLAEQDGNYNYELPSPPKDEDQILFYDAPKAEQYWKTPHSKSRLKYFTDKGDVRNINHMTEKERVEFIDFWRRAWLEGLWFFNNGEPTYITGEHVDHLVFNKFKSSHFYYLTAQKERFYFRDLVQKDRNCDGGLWAKGRRVGITAEQITSNVRIIIYDFSNNCALQSDTHEKAKSSLLTPLIDIYRKRPKWMREDFYSSNGKVPRASLELIDVVIRDDDNYPLGGTAKAFPSNSKALDGLEFMEVTMDEISKWETSAPYETYEINKKTIVNPGKRGKIWLLSTTGDSKEAQKATKDWHKLISDSNPKILNANGKTNSGLWVFFVSYIHSLELLENVPEIKDKYGNINKEMAEEYIWNEIKKYPKDSKEYIYALYKQPMELRHTLLTPTGQGYFSKIRITNRLDELRSMPNDGKPYVEGCLEEYEDGSVYFISNEEKTIRCEKQGIAYERGYWKIALLPYFSQETGIDTRNRYKKSKQGVYFPSINPEGAIGYDPIRYKKEDTTSNSLSQAAIISYKKFDYFNSGEVNQYCGLWLHRPDDPDDADKEAMKAAKFWGYPIMHERVIESVKKNFEAANMLPFLLTNPKDGKHGMWIDSQGKVVQNSIKMMQTRFNAPMKEEDDIDYYATHPFEESLQDMDLIDISNTTQFDTFMSMVELEQGLMQIVYTNQTDKTTNTLNEIILSIIPKRN